LVDRVIFLDTGPLGQITNPKITPANAACVQSYQSHVASGRRIIVPEIADYEIRRELLRANKTPGIARLDGLIQTIDYLPITTAAMRQAAAFWAQARQQGQQTSGDNTIDCDMIPAAQAVTLGASDFIIATTNSKHLSRFVPADLWQNIS
jgi:predicted nucleic acid-binding protein